MIPQLVTFDCAGTLVRANWSIPAVVTESAERIGIPIDPDQANLYLKMYGSRLREFAAVNLLRDPEAGRRFWIELARDWLEHLGLDQNLGESIIDQADTIVFGSDSKVFTLFDDTLPCLDKLRSEGIPCAVVSNWDYSLTRVLKMLGIADRFSVVLASLEEGWEKPDSRLFHLALARAGIPAEGALHVGDDPTDDLEGARAAGIRGVLLDRSGQTPNSIQSLDQLEASFAWTS